MKNKTMVVAAPDKQELFLTREFDAPVELVFKALSQPEYLVKWLLPEEQHMSVDYMDFRSGGAYRYLMPGPDGKQVGISGIIHEVLAPHRIIETFEYEGLPERGHVALRKTLFEELPEKRSKITIHFICESVTYRDGLVSSGMEAHTATCHDRLDELLKSNISL
jgi:uncharacterized protein YndB with AHSA1/START domain